MLLISKYSPFVKYLFYQIHIFFIFFFISGCSAKFPQYNWKNNIQLLKLENIQNDTFLIGIEKTLEKEIWRHSVYYPDISFSKDSFSDGSAYVVISKYEEKRRALSYSPRTIFRFVFQIEGKVTLKNFQKTPMTETFLLKENIEFDDAKSNIDISQKNILKKRLIRKFAESIVFSLVQEVSFSINPPPNTSPSL